jgi:hypothetical protein
MKALPLVAALAAALIAGCGGSDSNGSSGEDMSSVDAAVGERIEDSCIFHSPKARASTTATSGSSASTSRTARCGQTRSIAAACTTASPKIW